MRLVALVVAVFLTAQIAGAQEVNRFVEACALWAENQDQVGTKTVQEWTQIHRLVRVLQKEDQSVVSCQFRDLGDEVPELLSLEIGAERQDELAVRRLNLAIWRHFVPLQPQ